MNNKHVNPLEISDREYDILASIADDGGEKPFSFYQHASVEDRAMIDFLCRQGFLYFSGGEPDGLGDTLTYDFVRITPLGYRALSINEKIHNQVTNQNSSKSAGDRSEKRSEARRSWGQFIIGLLVTFLTVFLAAYLDKNPGFFDWLLGLFS